MWDSKKSFSYGPKIKQKKKKAFLQPRFWTSSTRRKNKDNQEQEYLDAFLSANKVQIDGKRKEGEGKVE